MFTIFLKYFSAVNIGKDRFIWIFFSFFWNNCTAVQNKFVFALFTQDEMSPENETSVVLKVKVPLLRNVGWSGKYNFQPENIMKTRFFLCKHGNNV